VLTLPEICSIIDEKVKKELELKNSYIAKNGYSHEQALDRFDTRIAAFSELYGRFKQGCTN
jgi:hypothetical protein